MEDLRSKLMRLIVVPEGLNRSPESVADELLAQAYRCADCANEAGCDVLQPAAEFAWRAAPRYTWGVARQSYCRRHQSLRNGAAQRERLKDPEQRKAQTARTLKSRPKERERRKLEARRRYARDPQRQYWLYLRWAERNPDKRKASQDAYRRRKRMRPSGVSALRGARH